MFAQAELGKPSSFRQPFGPFQQFSFGFQLCTPFDFGLDFFDQGYCFWCPDFKRGVHVRALPKTVAFQQASPIPKEGNKKAAAAGSPPATGWTRASRKPMRQDQRGIAA